MNITDEMVEQAAKAIHDHWQGAPNGRSWAACCEDLPGAAADFRWKGRAALEAALTAAEPEQTGDVAGLLDQIYSDPNYLGGGFPERDEEGLLPPGSPYDRGRYDARKIVSAALKRLSRHEASEAVRVKALKWEEATHIDDHPAWTAESIVGTYEVGFDDGWYGWLSDGMWEWQPEMNCRAYSGPNAAMAACQNDFKSRVLSALRPEPMPKGEEE